MTPQSRRGESGRDGDSGSGTGPDPRPTRRGLLVGVSLAGLGGALAGCSTAAVPYDANEAGVAPNAPTRAAGPGPGAMSSPGAAPSPAATPGGGMSSDPAPSGNARARKKAKVTGTVLGSASDIPVGGGAIYTAAKVVVTQPSPGQYKAFSAVCTHVGCIVNKVARGTIDCPCHGSEFKISNGAVVTGPAPSPLAEKKIKIANGLVHLL
jgi:nitrite reductase/ring-hydroxylating ferredoxin subunit